MVSELIQKCVDENAHTVIRQEEYNQRYEGLVARFETAKARLSEIDGLRREKKARRDIVEAFFDVLEKQGELITEFDELLWYSLVKNVMVHSGGNVFLFSKTGRR